MRTEFSDGFDVRMSAGEALDRLSIFEVKCKKLPEGEKRATTQKAFEDLAARLKPLFARDELTNVYLHLVEANEHLWNTEDAVRDAIREGDDEAFAKHAKNVPAQNGERSSLKAVVDELCGSDYAEMKQYADF
jgi:hypothetical protein